LNEFQEVVQSVAVGVRRIEIGEVTRVITAVAGAVLQVVRDAVAVSVPEDWIDQRSNFAGAQRPVIDAQVVKKALVVFIPTAIGKGKRVGRRNRRSGKGQ
jgi:hypothetical protein